MSLNKVMLIGNVGKDPEIRYIDNGVCTATMSLATTTPGYTLQNGTHVPERPDWHRVELWRTRAERGARYVHKGEKIYIEGQLRTRSFTDKKGATRYVTEIWADNLELLGGRPAAAQPAAPQTAAAPQQTQQPSASSFEMPAAGGTDLPF
ncbi:MAG: single-stranded DNA-binding protein [Bacteroidales bacterium]